MSGRNMQHLFSQVPIIKTSRSAFNRSHGVKTTFDAGKLVPVLVDEVLPGDTFKLNATFFARVATLISPIMDNVYLESFFFYVPERLVYDKFVNMCGEQEDPDDPTDFLFPMYEFPSDVMTEGTLMDYMGLPIKVKNRVRLEPFRAYWLIWNEWFRDENLQDSMKIERGEAGYISKDHNDIEYYKLAPRGKRHDYFTSALPWPQKGPAVDLPFGGTASIESTIPEMYPMKVSDVSSGSGYKVSKYQLEDTSYPIRTSALYVPGQSASWTDTYLNLPNFETGLTVDLTSATAVTINQFREAFQIQRWYERLARGGSRYVELVMSFYGVRIPDARLQRPEYLGGSTSRLDISTVPQTSASGDVTPQGNLAAFGTIAQKHHGFVKSFTEHGWIIGLVNVRADLTYQQGTNRMWYRETKFDMYWPTFAHLGEQVVYNKEIYTQGTVDDDKAFGYQERYAEYRYFPSMVTGKFRSTFDQPLDSWHLAQKFDSLPALSSEFIQDNPPMDRVIATQDESQFLLDCWFDMKCVRPMPVYSVPGLVDHF